jgi:hypothetical protein
MNIKIIINIFQAILRFKAELGNKFNSSKV